MGERRNKWGKRCISPNNSLILLLLLFLVNDTCIFMFVLQIFVVLSDVETQTVANPNKIAIRKEPVSHPRKTTNAKATCVLILLSGRYKNQQKERLGGKE
eukprot:TRINITY_DN35494_c0_g1_i1.p1 TRINITY_DN35494_c0_g1~~TRINITY_DN35494_c0_g1_i1.p1  ORF type:complete len:100 (-),score=2.26 TRINITY_DN35494_c0_g1_i1:140-439(-)